MNWYITVSGDQQAWQDWCEQFMSSNITIIRRFYEDKILVTCQIDINPYKPIDSTGSMPSLINQAMSAGFQNIQVLHF